MVEKILTNSEVKWHYFVINWELRDLFPETGTKIDVVVGGKSIEVLINRRNRIRNTELFRILKPETGDSLSIIRKGSTTYELELKHKPRR